MKSKKISVLMSVYFREKAPYLRESLQSIKNQTWLPDQVVIVKDGTLNSELNQVLKNFYDECHTLFEITLVSIETRVDLGTALNRGLEVCEFPIIARMDSDDHALKNRFENQIRFFSRHPDVKVWGGSVQEFCDTWDNPISYRKVPTSLNDIKKFSRIRNPLNHMTVMFDKNYINDLGGYHCLPGFEDYDLWLRVLKQEDGLIANSSRVLVAARVNNLQNRRGGVKYILQNIHARYRFYCEGTITLPSFIISSTIGVLVGIFPNKLRGYFYKTVLRRENP